MILENLHIIGEEGIKHLQIADGKIHEIVSDRASIRSVADELCIDCEGALAFPGLINSHDHLDFNLFPQLGNRIYKSYVEWGADIQTQNKDIIEAITKIPKELRVEWGMYKNLLNGITTVVNHGEYLDIKEPLINVFQNCYSLHSVSREKFWKFKLNNPFTQKWPFVIHIGEGTDKASFDEINELLKWNFFNRKLIGVHGVAMDSEQASKFEGLIWCPAANFFLLNKTAFVNELKTKTKILFGTDSTLTASWNIWDHLRLARTKGFLTDQELFESLTLIPANTWNMANTGCLIKDQASDIVLARSGTYAEKWDDFYGLNPEDILMVLHQGRIRLLDAELVSKININFKGFSKVLINGSAKLVYGDVPVLMKNIWKYNPTIKFPVTCD